MSVESLFIAILIPIFVFLLFQFADTSRRYYKWLYFLVFLEYNILLFYCAVGKRVALADYYIQTELFWGYHKPTDYIFEDNIINIIVFIPIGFLASLFIGRFKIIISLLIGLFISETIECSQLILKRGTFDVDDLFNNVIGAIVGAIIYIALRMSYNKFKERNNRNEWTRSHNFDCGPSFGE